MLTEQGVDYARKEISKQSRPTSRPHESDQRALWILDWSNRDAAKAAAAPKLVGSVHVLLPDGKRYALPGTFRANPNGTIALVNEKGEALAENNRPSRDAEAIARVVSGMQWPEQPKLLHWADVVVYASPQIAGEVLDGTRKLRDAFARAKRSAN